MKHICAPNAFSCHAEAFTHWLSIDHGAGVLAAVVLATVAAWVFANATA